MNPDPLVKLFADKSPTELTINDPPVFCSLEAFKDPAKVRSPEVSAVNTDPICIPPFNADMPDTVRFPVTVELLETAVDNKVANEVPPINVVDGVPPIDRVPEISTFPLVLTLNLLVLTVIPPLRYDIPPTIRSPEISELVAVEVLI